MGFKLFFQNLFLPIKLLSDGFTSELSVILLLPKLATFSSFPKVHSNNSYKVFRSMGSNLLAKQIENLEFLYETYEESLECFCL